MPDSLKNKSMRGMAWTGFSRLGTQFSQFVIGIILARLLMPEDYGVIAMLTFFIAIAETFLDSGFASALIQKKDRTEIDFSTVFYFNLVISIALYTIFYILSPFIADFYGMPILNKVTRVVALSLIINGLAIVQTAKLTIDLNFKAQAIASITATFLSGLLAIYLAFKGWGVWALAFQGISSSSTRTLILWILSRWRPLLSFSYDSFQKLFSFGSKILCSGMINTVYENLYTLVIGKVFTASEVGFFNRGDHFAQLPTKTVQQMVVQVNYPILSSMQDDEERLVNTYQKLLTSPMFLLYPLLIGLIVLAEPLIIVLIGEKWLPCVPILQIACIGCLFDPLTHINLNLLYVKGRSDLVLKLEFIKKPIAFLILFISIPFGLLWMCFGRSLYSFIAFVFNCYYSGKMIGLGFFIQMRMLFPIVFRSLLMGFFVFISTLFVDNSILKLIVGTIIGFLFYVLVCEIMKDRTYLEIKSMVLWRYYIHN